MRVIRGLKNLKPEDHGCVVTIGNFDGVHLGHQQILSHVTERARQLGVRSLLICFEPQPREFFDAFDAPARLTRFREKLGLLEHYGIDLVLCLKFNERTRSIPANAFIDVLVNDLGVKSLFVGDDWRFGHDRTGDFEQLKRAGKERGFEVTNQYTLAIEHIRVSSTRIRECLSEGDFELAEKLLGHPYSIVGKVVYGRQLGRTLGTPTANIQLHRYRAPIDGVYAIEVLGLDKPYEGVANVGVRPTIDDQTPQPILEVHIFGMSETIYGRCVEVVFRKKLREEKKFDGIEALKRAISRDVEDAEAFFAEMRQGTETSR